MANPSKPRHSMPEPGAGSASNRRLQLGAGVVFLALIVVALVVIVGGRGDTPAPSSAEVVGVRETELLYEGVPQDGWVLGDPAAPVTIVEFVDLQCPFCRDHQLDQAPRIVTELVRTKRAKLQISPLAFLGEDSVAGRAAMARMAEEDRAFNFMNLWYFNQGPEGSGYATEGYIAKLLEAAGGDRSLAAPRLPEGAAADLTQASAELGEALLGSPTSPAFAVGSSSEAPERYEVLDPGAGADELAEAVRKVGAGG